MKKPEVQNTEPDRQTGVSEVRDLSSFCQMWPQLRSNVPDNIQKGDVVTEESAETIRWLILMADKVFLDFDN